MSAYFFNQKILVNTLVISFLLSSVAIPAVAQAVEDEVTYTGINTNISGDDEHTGEDQGPFDIGFDFNYYGTDYSQVDVNINGVLNLGHNYTTGFSNYELSDSSAFENSIFAFWDDLNTEGDEIIYYATIGSEPDRKFVVQWTNLYFFNTDIQMGTFQTILYEDSNKIQIQYRDLLGGDRALGNSATIGIKKDDTTYSQYSHDTVSIEEGQAIRYTPDGADDYTEDDQAEYDPIYLAPEGAPSSPELVNPTDGTEGVTLTPTFEWLPVEEADSYTVLVSTVSDFSSTVVNQSDITDTSYTLDSDLTADTQYYWRVQSVNSDGSSLSSTRTFTTGSENTAPNVPSEVTSDTLLGGEEVNDLSNATLTAGLSDDDEDEQVRYRLQIATDVDFNQLALDYRSPFGDEGKVTYTYGESEGSYLVGSATTSLDVDDYYLRLRTEDDAAASSEWYESEGVAFSVVPDEEGPAISDVSTSPGATSTTIDWTTDETASSQVEYGPSSSYSASTTVANLSPGVIDHQVVIDDLDPCLTYHFRIRSVDDNDNQTTGNDRTFTTQGCTADADVTAQTAGLAATSSDNTIELQTDDRGIMVSVPAGYATSTAHFQLKKIDAGPIRDVAPAPSDLDLVADHTYSLQAVTDDLQIISRFNEPVGIELSYSDEDIESVDKGSLSVFRFDGVEWQELNDCSVDTGMNTVSCTTDRFSTFALFGSEETSSSQKSRSTRFGCKDKEALNFDRFSSHKQELCEYDDSDASNEVDGSEEIEDPDTFDNAEEFEESEEAEGSDSSNGSEEVQRKKQNFENIIDRNREHFIEMHNSGIKLPQSILDVLELSEDTIAVRDLELGMKGDDVRKLQTLLINEGYDIPAGATGNFLEQTRSALVN
ncbi:MAG: fibronectin type III domain-containing protein, partial [Candidatus Paceibacterota bacterium]